MPKRKRDDQPSSSNAINIPSSITTITPTITTTPNHDEQTRQQQKSLPTITDRAIRIKASRLSAKLDQGTKQLKTALQLARGFERQKLGRRQKAASDNPKVLLRLREEVIILKELDLGGFAKRYLIKKLGGMKRVRESEGFRAVFPDGVAEGGEKRSVAESNVLGLLCKSNPVREVMGEVVRDVRRILGISDHDDKDRDGKGGGKGREERGESASGSKNGAVVELEGGEEEDEDFAGFSDGVGNEYDLVGGRRDIDEQSGVEDGDDDDDNDEIDYDAYNSRLAASSDSESDPEYDGMNLDNHLNHPRDMSITPSLSDNDSNENNNSNSSVSSSSPPPPSTKPTTNSTRLHAPSSKPTSTTFLPSLSMAGYYSGGDSDSDSNTTPFSDGFKPSSTIIKPERKNRRGQRARQQIAEKKYGAKAKHLSNPKPKNLSSANGGAGDAGDKNRNVGWDMKRGAVSISTDRNRKGGGKFMSTGRSGNANRKGQTITGANGDVLGSRKGLDNSKKNKGGGDGSGGVKDGPLHPSWEAARKRKIAEGGKVVFEGKKVVFD